MKTVFVIGSQTIDIVHAELLPSQLEGLLKIEGGSSSDAQITLEFATETGRCWKMDVWRKDRRHFIGRNSHLFEIDKESRLIRITILLPFTNDQIYWFQRDLFGVLPCLCDELLLHSSALVYHGKGYIFCGDSGTGKSTVAKMLSKKAHVINDEINWVFWNEKGVPVLVNQRFWMRNDPIAGLPIAGLYLLEQASTCSVVENVAPVESLPNLLALHIGLDTGDTSLVRRSEGLAKLVEQINIKRLRFVLNAQEVEKAVLRAQ